MARPTKKRRICQAPAYCQFGPIDASGKQEVVTMDVTEYECLRLIDYVGMTQEECAKHMNVVRTSITGMYAKARNKLADCLLNGKKLVIEGGSYTICQGSAEGCSCDKSADQ